MDFKYSNKTEHFIFKIHKKFNIQEHLIFLKKK